MSDIAKQEPERVRGGNDGLMASLALFSLIISFILILFFLSPSFIESLLVGDIEAILSNEANIFSLIILSIIVFSLVTLIKNIGISQELFLSRIRRLKISLKKTGSDGKNDAGEDTERNSLKEPVLEVAEGSEDANKLEESVKDEDLDSESKEDKKQSSDVATASIDIRSIESNIDKKIYNIINNLKGELTENNNKLTSQISSLMNDLKELSERVNSIEGNIESLIIDVKTAVSELSNPFNYLRKFAEENELKDMGVDLSKYAQTQKNSENSGASTAKVEDHNINRSNNNDTGSVDEELEIEMHRNKETYESSEDRKQESLDLGNELRNILSSNLKVSQVMKLIVSIGELINNIDRSKVFDIIELGFSLNIIPNESKDIVASIIRVLEETKAPPKTLALILYKLAKSLGVNDREADFLAIAYSGGDEMWQIRQ